jgi:hypothetical protein
MLGFTVYIKFATNLKPFSSSTMSDWSYIVDQLPWIGVLMHDVGV